MQLRSFSGYNKTAPFVPVLTGLVGQTANFSCSLVNLDGNSAAAGWWQIFDLTSVTSLVSGTTVPLKSIKVSAAGSIPSITNALGAINLVNGLCVAMSSTELVYTTVATAFDVYGEIAEFEKDNTIGTTLVSDLTGSATLFQVWSEASGLASKKSLYRLELTEVAGLGCYVIISPQNTLTTAQLKAYPSPIISLGISEVKVINFGDNGFQPFFFDGTNFYYGCTVVSVALGSDESIPAFPGTQTLIPFKCKAWYR